MQYKEYGTELKTETLINVLGLRTNYNPKHLNLPDFEKRQKITCWRKLNISLTNWVGQTLWPHGPQTTLSLTLSNFTITGSEFKEEFNPLSMILDVSFAAFINMVLKFCHGNSSSQDRKAI